MKLLYLVLLTLLLTPKEGFSQDEVFNKIEICDSSKLYTVSGLKSLFPENNQLPIVEQPPAYKGGDKKIRNYLKKGLDLGNFDKSQTIPVYILFDVNCNGEAGNFYVNICEKCSNREFFKNQLIKLFKALPQNWNPGLKDGQKVDCHHLISFAINLGHKNKNGIQFLRSAK
ncbi:MAG: hypothetical protein ACWA41_06670 [Putridiphycobacter sp.]